MAQNEQLDIRERLRRTLVHTSRRLMVKYGTRGGDPVPTDPALLMRKLSLKEAESPIGRLSQTLLPMLQERLNKLVCLLDPAQLLEDTLSKLKRSSADCQEVEDIHGLITLTVPLCWPEGPAEESEVEYLESRRARLRLQNIQLAQLLSQLFIQLQIFWLIVHQFTEESLSDARMEHVQLTFIKETILKQINLFIEFLRNCLFNVVGNDLQRFVRILSDAMPMHVPKWNEYYQYKTIDPKQPMVPVIKLNRAFLNKISRETNHDIVMFRRMEPKQFGLLQQAAYYIPYWVGRMDDSVGVLPHNHEFVVHNLASLLHTYARCFKILDPFLKSPPPEVDPKLAEAASRWFTVWYQQLRLALHNISDFIGCDFPTQEYCDEVSMVPRMRA